MRRISILASSLIATAVAFVSGVSPAFATTVTPISDSGSPSQSVSHAAGLAVWQTSLIVVGGLVVLAAATTFALKLSSHRSAVRAAIR